MHIYKTEQLREMWLRGARIVTNGGRQDKPLMAKHIQTTSQAR